VGRAYWELCRMELERLAVRRELTARREGWCSNAQNPAAIGARRDLCARSMRDRPRHLRCGVACSRIDRAVHELNAPPSTVSRGY
jgi:hypothetical protein